MRRRQLSVLAGATIVLLVLASTSLPALAQPNYAKVKEFRIERSIPPEAVACIECHKQTNPGLFGDWANSRHASANITCLDCHLAQPGDQDVAKDHEKYYGRSDLPYGEQKYKVPADVWSVTSYKELYRDAVDCERHNLLHPGQKARTPFLSSLLSKEQGVFVAASDYMKVLPASIAKWVPGPLHCLGTDGFGRSDGRAELRDFFEVDARYIAVAALRSLAEQGAVKADLVAKAIKDLDINPDKLNPHTD